MRQRPTIRRLLLLRLLPGSPDIDQYDLLLSGFVAVSKDGQAINGAPVQVLMAASGLQHMGILFEEIKEVFGFPYEVTYLTIGPFLLQVLNNMVIALLCPL